MENYNHSQRKYSKGWYEAFGMEDTRYYGLFIKGREEKGHILIDPKRFEKIFSATDGMPDCVKKVMDRRNGPLFYPAKKERMDYNVNFVLEKLFVIKREWDTEQKPIINRFLSEIIGKDYHLYDDDLFQCGIVDANEAAYRAQMTTVLAREFAAFKKNRLHSSLYAQYFHQMASHIDAILLQLLTRNGYEGDKFNRNVLYAFKGKNLENVKSLDGFKEYDRMYAVWNFIKHNSISTFNAVKDNFPEILMRNEYNQGEPACYFIDFSDELVDSILAGVERFFKEYCRMVFDEDAQEAAWNFEKFFLEIVREEINSIQNPLGLGDFIL
jgi:hypothetical protein